MNQQGIKVSANTPLLLSDRQCEKKYYFPQGCQTHIHRLLVIKCSLLQRAVRRIRSQGGEPEARVGLAVRGPVLRHHHHHRRPQYIHIQARTPVYHCYSYSTNVYIFVNFIMKYQKNIKLINDVKSQILMMAVNSGTICTGNWTISVWSKVSVFQFKKFFSRPN